MNLLYLLKIKVNNQFVQTDTIKNTGCDKTFSHSLGSRKVNYFAKIVIQACTLPINIDSEKNNQKCLLSPCPCGRRFDLRKDERVNCDLSPKGDAIMKPLICFINKFYEKISHRQLSN